MKNWPFVIDSFVKSLINGKLVLPKMGSQAGAWEPASMYILYFIGIITLVPKPQLGNVKRLEAPASTPVLTFYDSINIDVAICEVCDNRFLTCENEHVDYSRTGYNLPRPKHRHRWIDIMRM